VNLFIQLVEPQSGCESRKSKAVTGTGILVACGIKDDNKDKLLREMAASAITLLTLGMCEAEISKWKTDA
jgi:hypothetical protein